MISDTTSQNAVNIFWQLLSIFIPGVFLQPVVSVETNVRIIIPHTCTSLHMSCEWNGRQVPHFHYKQNELETNDVEKCLPSWGLYMLLVYGGFSLNVWDGESFENTFHLDQKVKVDKGQHAMLLCIPFK